MLMKGPAAISLGIKTAPGEFYFVALISTVTRSTREVVTSMPTAVSGSNKARFTPSPTELRYTTP